MRDLGLNPGASTSKCAGIVGETMKRYHPHGENSIYPTLTRMGQWWNSRHLLVHAAGQFRQHSRPAAGGDAVHRGQARARSPPRCSRTSSSTRSISSRITTRSTRSRGCCPGNFPNLLVNGSGGIAVGMATSMPPHNLGEVCDALVAYIDDPTIDLDAIMELLPGPDFPTGATLCGRMGIKEAYMTGRGRVVDPRQVRDRRAQGRPEPDRLLGDSVPAHQGDAAQEAGRAGERAAGSPECRTSTTTAIASSRCGSPSP